MASKVGFIGLHRDLQLTLVENILKAEFPLTVYDPSEEPLAKAARMGAQVASSPKEVAEQADIISVSLREERETEEALLGPEGVLAGAQPGSVIVIHTTVEPEFAVRIGDIAKAQNIGVLDVAYSGGVEMARTSSMLYAVGGEKEHLDRCHPVFATSASTIAHVGPLGSGMAARIVDHVVVALNRLAVDEGMRLAEALGLDTQKLAQAMLGGEAHSEMLERYANAPWAGAGGGVPPRLLSMALKLAYDRGVSLPGLALHQQVYVVPTQSKQ